MSGWGNWLEKGKALAATIDQQINESVGVEHSRTGNNDHLNDAWNDDFDDDDVLNDESNGWNEEQTLQQPQFSSASSTLVPVEHDSMLSSVSDTPKDCKVVMESVDEKTSTAIAKDHFSPPSMPEPAEVTKEQDETLEPDENEGWDNDLHVDSLDFEEQVPESEQQSPPETVQEHTTESLPKNESLQEEIEFQATVEESSPDFVDSQEASEKLGNDEAGPSEDISEPVEKEVPESPPSPRVDFEIQSSPLFEKVDTVEMYETIVEIPPLEPEVPVEINPDIAVPKEFENDGQQQDVPSKADESFAMQSQAEVDAKVLELQEESQMAVALLQSQLEDLQIQLGQREDQLTSKAEQLTTMQAIFESEKEELRKKIADTKEEAKRRILKAKERVEAMEKRLANASKSADEAGAQSEVIAALREEGEKLAHKQSEMEKAVRAAKGETRDLREQLEAEIASKDKALEKIASLEAELKRTKDDLASARKGESQVVKLDAELLSLKEECQRKATANLSLEQQVKELKAENKELRTEVEQARRGAELEKQDESKKLKKEHNDLLSDLENKLRTSEREANMREDALRHEVTEIRKRWQDAVRRADALSMDVQQSTAPLLRQLESLERQSRARAATWAELETKLRSDLDESVIENENLVKERNDFKSTASRLQRLMKDRDEELTTSRSKLDDQSVKIKQLETKLTAVEAERQKLKEKYEEIEKVANEGVSKVRSDMMQTVVESEERYRAQIESAEKELKTEREIRSQLERQVEQLLENSGMIQLPPTPGAQLLLSEEKPKKLRSTEGQAEILASTLNGFDSDEDDGISDEEGEESSTPIGLSSFAAMEELNQRLKCATVELKSLREQLAGSERTRESLMGELIESRHAREKLPLFEAKVKELTEETREKELEIMGLREDLQEVKELYRSQMNILLEEKAAAMAPSGLNGGVTATPIDDEADDWPLESEELQTS
jgi:chromosome segregation ATPase